MLNHMLKKKKVQVTGDYLVRGGSVILHGTTHIHDIQAFRLGTQQS